MSAAEDRVVNLLGVAATGLSDRVSAALIEASGLDELAASALVTLLDFSPAGSVRRLALGLGLSHSGAVRLVDRLVAAGLAGREPGPDARTVQVRLTRRGRSVAGQARAGRAAAIASALSGVPERQRRDLARVLDLVVANLTRDRLAERAAGAGPAGGALCRLCDFAACGRAAGSCPAVGVTGYRP